jgi:hypothetical protein
MSPKPKQAPSVRPVLYPEPETVMHYGQAELTVAQAKELLGWEEETDTAKFGTDYMLIDRTGKKVRCVNNAGNRPWYGSWADTLAQEHLMRRWRLNGETIVIGKTGLVLSAQHRLISLVLAEQERANATDAKGERWGSLWPDEVTMPAIVVYGIDESDDTVNTLDTGKPRSLTDVIYRSPFFADLKSGDRRTVSRHADYAVRMLWFRTGANMDPFAPRRTHAESLDFIARHPRVLEAVKHLFEEESGSERRISKYITLGTAAGLMYLMGCSGSADEACLDYQKASPSNEEQLSWEMWDKASEFWVMLADNSPAFKPVRAALGNLMNTDDGTGGSVAEKTAVLAKAWECYAEGEMPTVADMELEYHTDADGIRHFVDDSTFGGIDLGDKREAPPADPTEDEIEARKAEALARRSSPANGPSKPTAVAPPQPKPKAAPKAAKVVAAATATAAAKPGKRKAADNGASNFPDDGQGTSIAASMAANRTGGKKAAKG